MILPEVKAAGLGLLPGCRISLMRSGDRAAWVDRSRKDKYLPGDPLSLNSLGHYEIGRASCRERVLERV